MALLITLPPYKPHTTVCRLYEVVLQQWHCSLKSISCRPPPRSVAWPAETRAAKTQVGFSPVRRRSGEVPAVAWSATRAAETQVTLSAARGRSSQALELVERSVPGR